MNYNHYFCGWQVKDIEEAFAVKDYLLTRGLWNEFLEKTEAEKEKTALKKAVANLALDIKDSKEKLNKLQKQLEKLQN